MRLSAPSSLRAAIALLAGASLGCAATRDPKLVSIASARADGISVAGCSSEPYACSYCWFGTDNAGNCPEEWNSTGDGCDCGCQFLDGDCPPTPPAPAGSTGCQGSQCGSAYATPDGCYCDAACIHYGDCCANACTTCGLCDSGLPVGQPGGGSCQLFSDQGSVSGDTGSTALYFSGENEAWFDFLVTEDSWDSHSLSVYLDLVEIETSAYSFAIATYSTHGQASLSDCATVVFASFGATPNQVTLRFDWPDESYQDDGRYVYVHVVPLGSARGAWTMDIRGND